MFSPCQLRSVVPKLCCASESHGCLLKAQNPYPILDLLNPNNWRWKSKNIFKQLLR